MNVQMLSGAVNVYEKFTNVGDALGYALPFSLFGFGVVFFVLVLLWGILAVFGAVFAEKKPKAPKASKTEKKPEPKVEAVQVASAEPAATPAPSNDTELIAVITAAISAFRSASGNSIGGFRVVSFKKRK